MEMRIIDITPNTKFYVVNGGKVVAAKFTKVEIYLNKQCDFIHGIECSVEGILQLANGIKIPTKMLYRFIYKSIWGETEIYSTPEDARNQKNRVLFTFSVRDFYTFTGHLGYTPIQNENTDGVKYNRYYSLWYFNSESYKFGARLTPIFSIDLFKGTVSAEPISKPPKLYNTKEECERDNTVEVVDFPDEPEDEPKQDNPDAVHIVFLGVVID